MIYISAGHNPYGKKIDPGAVGNGYHEADLTVALRNLIIKELVRLDAKFVSDQDTETLAEYIKRIKPGSGSVVCEIHFNAGPETATGVEVIYPGSANAEEIHLAATISKMISTITGLTNRGAKDESKSHHSRLAILHTGAGISVLPEICFISSKSDLIKYNVNREAIAKSIALLLVEADRIYS